MTFSRNLLVNTGSQLLVGLVGILTVPLLVRLLGTESYGLVAFFVTLQAWVALLDLGLGQALSRQTARFRAGALGASDFHNLIVSIRVLFIVGALGSAAAIWLASGWISTSWLKVETLDPSQVASAIALMGAAVAIRWWSGMYRGVITGHERFVWLGSFNIIMAVLRYGLVFPVLIYSPSGATVTTYFAYQVAVSAFELAVASWKARRLTATVRRAGEARFRWATIRKELAFSLSLTFSSFVWILVTQSDRLTLSKVLTLDDYAVFSLAVTLASAITMISAPAAAVILPRLTRLMASAPRAEVDREYIRSTKIIALAVFPVAGALAISSYPFLLIWTGDSKLSLQAAPIASLYILGNGVLAVSAFAYYLQYAIGNLRLHVIANILLATLLLPAQIVLASVYGGVGAGVAWLGLNIVYLAAWMPYVHHKLAPGIHTVWLVRAVLLPFASVSIALAAMVQLERATGPWPPLMQIVGSSVAAMVGVLIPGFRLWRESYPRHESRPSLDLSDAEGRTATSDPAELRTQGRL